MLPSGDVSAKELQTRFPVSTAAGLATVPPNMVVENAGLVKFGIGLFAPLCSVRLIPDQAVSPALTVKP